MEKVTKYPKAMIMIHWLTVVLLAIIAYIGITMEDYEFNEVNMNRYRAHALLGMLVLILTIVRFFIKKKNKNNLPQDITYYSSAHKTMVSTIQALIYTLLIVAPLVGFIMVYQTGALTYDLGGPFPEGATFNETLEKVHKVLVFSLGGLIIAHVGGVMMYKIKTGENLIKKMCLLIK